MPMHRATLRDLEPTSERVPDTWLRQATVLVVALVCCSTAGCVTVRPQERAILADPVMRFDASAREEAELQHVLDNREGSFGGGALQGGGCGCN